MSKAQNKKYNSNIMEHAIKRQRKLQRTVGVNWWYEKSKTSKVFLVLSEIAFYFNMFIASIMLTDCSMKIEDLTGNPNRVVELEYVKNVMSSFLTATILLIAAYILKKAARLFVKGKSSVITKIVIIVKAIVKKIKKLIRKEVEDNGINNSEEKSDWYENGKSLFIAKKLYFFAMLSALLGGAISFIISLRVRVLSITINDVEGVVVLDQPNTSNVFKTYFEFITYHALPLLIFAVAMVLFYVMCRSDVKEKVNICNSITEKLYKDFIAANPSYSQAQWEQHLNAYNGDSEENEGGKMKRSKRSRLKKNKE